MEVDKNRIEKYLLEITKNARKIESILKEAEIKNALFDEITKFALKYLVIEIAEAMANVLQHILAKNFGIAVKGYIDTVKKGYEKGIISEELMKKLKPFFDFRNSLIHRYWIVDDDIFIKNLEKGYRDFFHFCNEIENFLKKLRGLGHGNTT